LQRPSSKTGQPVGKVLLAKCAIEIYAQQNFVYTKHGYVMTDESVCLDVNEAQEDTSVMLIACSEFKRQKWKYDPLQKSLTHLQSNLCLDVTKTKILTLKTCSFTSKSQNWLMIPMDWQ
jgi:hypothetical protein